MTELGVHFFESTGVGANASQDPQTVFFANSPLSELVWSQTDGLGIKYTTSSGIAEKKTPIFWSTDTFNIIVNTPFNGVCLLTKDEKYMDNNQYRSVSELGPRNLMMRHERVSRSCGEIDFMNERNRGFNEKIIINEKLDENWDKFDGRNKNLGANRGIENDDVSASVFRPCSSSYQERVENSSKIAKSSQKEEIMENKTRKILNKGKEKVIYDERENTARESDNSNESVESTGSIMSKRKRPFKFCNSNNLESKRIKKEVNKSSFANWISSISTGFNMSNETRLVKPLSIAKDPSSIEKGMASNASNVKTIMPFEPNGFGSFFHSLYRQNTPLSPCSNKKESFSLEKSSPNNCKGLNVGLNSTDRSNDEIKPDNPNRLSVEKGNSIEKKEENKGWACVIRTNSSSNSSNNDKSRSNEEKENNINGNEGYLENFWIARLLPKEATSSKLRTEKCNEGQSENNEKKFKSNLNPIIPSNKRNETDCMASLFARRLGAIKHAEPSNFCSFKNLDKIEEELGGSKSKSKSNSKSRSNDQKMVLWKENKGKNVINESSGERNFECKELGSSSNENIGNKGKGIIKSNENQNDNLLHYNSVDVTSTIFEFVKRLRLSRLDIIRCMKSSIKSENLDGFYLRLRLSKLKQEIGRTGYHVARINGTSGDKFLSVRVGRLTYLVEPHCISNQDFLKDELRAWLSSSQIGDFSLPSREELDRKIKEKHQLLGL